MAQAIVNPEELEKFAHSVKQFSEGMQQNVTQLLAQFSGLSGTWRDQEHQKFAEEFQHTVQVLGRFVQVADQHVPFLLRKAQRVRDYLNQR